MSLSNPPLRAQFPRPLLLLLLLHSKPVRTSNNHRILRRPTARKLRPSLLSNGNRHRLTRHPGRNGSNNLPHPRMVLTNLLSHKLGMGHMARNQRTQMLRRHSNRLRNSMRRNKHILPHMSSSSINIIKRTQLPTRQPTHISTVLSHKIRCLHLRLGIRTNTRRCLIRSIRNIRRQFLNRSI